MLFHIRIIKKHLNVTLVRIIRCLHLILERIDIGFDILRITGQILSFHVVGRTAAAVTVHHRWSAKNMKSGYGISKTKTTIPKKKKPTIIQLYNSRLFLYVTKPH